MYVSSRVLYPHNKIGSPGDLFKGTFAKLVFIYFMQNNCAVLKMSCCRVFEIAISRYHVINTINININKRDSHNDGVNK